MKRVNYVSSLLAVSIVSCDPFMIPETSEERTSDRLSGTQKEPRRNWFQHFLPRSSSNALFIFTMTCYTFTLEYLGGRLIRLFGFSSTSRVRPPHKYSIGSITDFASGGFVCRNRLDRGVTAAKVQRRRPNCSRGFNKLFSRIPSTTLFGAVSGSGIPHRGWRLHLLATSRLLDRSADDHSGAFLLQCRCIHRRYSRTHASVSWQK